MKKSNKVLSAVIAIPLALGIAGGLQAETKQDKILKKLKGPITHSTNIDTSTQEGPSLKEILEQWRKEEGKKADFWNNLVSFSMNADVGYKNFIDFYSNNGIEEQKKSEGPWYEIEAKLKFGKSAGGAKNFFITEKLKNTETSGDYRLREIVNEIGIGKEDKDFNKSKCGFSIKYKQANRNVSGKDLSLNLTYNKETKLEGVLAEVYGDFGDIFPGFYAGLSLESTFGPQSTNVKLPDFNYDNTENGTAKENITTISGSYDFGNLIKNKYLQFKVRQNVEWKNQEATMPSGSEAFNYFTYRISPQYSLSLEDIKFIAGAEYVKNWMLGGPAGTNLKNSEEISAGIRVEIYEDFVPNCMNYFKNLFKKNKNKDKTEDKTKEKENKKRK